jgi:hypothetical protein
MGEPLGDNRHMENDAKKWICCGHDIEALCAIAGTVPPGKCFFCGLPREDVNLSPRPEDTLAFELAEIWCRKIREYHGDSETHAPSFDQYGRSDTEAWRAVARHVLKRTTLSEFIHYEVRDSSYGLLGTLTIPRSTSLSTNDIAIFHNLKCGGFITTTTNHTMKGQDPRRQILDPCGKHLLTLVLTDTVIR